jgi:hypothetical protein
LREGRARYLAAWCEEKSLCRQAIRSEFGAQADIRVFEWRGTNSPDARLDAADALNLFLQDIRYERPASPVFVVAHSHAGNVVLYAARKSRERCRIDGVGFLSTPFLHVRPRILGFGLAKKLELTASLVLVFSLLLMYALFQPASLWHVLRHFQTFVRESSAPVILVLGGSLLARVALIPALRALHRWNHAFAYKLRLPSQLPFPVLIIRAAADEAAGLLGAGQLVSHQATRLLRAGFRMVPSDPFPPVPGMHLRLIERWRRLANYHKAGLVICLTSCLPLALAVLFSAAGIHLGREMGYLLGSVALGGLVLGVLLMSRELLAQLIVMPLFVALNMVAAAIMTVFGLRFALATLGMDISTEPTPPGRWTSLQLPFSRQPYETRRGLSHATHSDPAALQEMMKWFRELTRC